MFHQPTKGCSIRRGKLLTIIKMEGDQFMRGAPMPRAVYEDLAGPCQPSVTASSQMPTLDKEIHLLHY